MTVLPMVKIETFLVPEALLLCQGPEAAPGEMQTSLGWKEVGLPFLMGWPPATPG